MQLTGKNWIAGGTSAEGAKTFTSVAPRTRLDGSSLFYEATAVEVEAASLLAAEAFKQTRTYPPMRIAAFLDALATRLDEHKDDLVAVADEETALGVARLTGELGRTTGQLRAFANLLREGSYVDAIIDTALPDRIPAPRPDIRRMLVPIGPVAIFSASNFPFAFAVCGGDTVSAWAAGCPVVVKGHPSHPATSESFAILVNEVIHEQDFPLGFFSLLQGASTEVGQTLVSHPKIEAVGFTGSLRGGRALFDIAAQRPKPIPVYAEMGSVNPLVVLPGALQNRLELLAEGLVNSVTLGAGQFCTKPGVVLLVDSPSAQTFIEQVALKMEAREPGFLLNHSVESNLTNTVSETLRQPDVSLISHNVNPHPEGFCFPNTVLKTTAAAFTNNSFLQVEHFGPVTLFVVCADEQEMDQVIRNLHGALTATIHGEAQDADRAEVLFAALREKAGRLIWNGFPTGVEVVYAQQHGGPYPATTTPATTSVGMTAIRRFLRPVAYQNLPDMLLPDALKNVNPLGILRLVDGGYTRDSIS